MWQVNILGSLPAVEGNVSADGYGEWVGFHPGSYAKRVETHPFLKGEQKQGVISKFI